jgi:hypothetical protein
MVDPAFVGRVVKALARQEKMGVQKISFVGLDKNTGVDRILMELLILFLQPPNGY